MKVFPGLKKRAVVLIGVLAIATLSLVPLSSAHNESQQMVVGSNSQSFTSTNKSDATTFHSSLNTKTDTQSAGGNSANSSNASTDLTENVTVNSTGSTQPINTDNQVTPPATTTIPPSTTVTSCSPCENGRFDNVETHSLVCPMIMCEPINPPPPVTTPPVTIQPNPSPQPSCNPCGVNPGGENIGYACDMVCAD